MSPRFFNAENQIHAFLQLNPITLKTRNSAATTLHSMPKVKALNRKRNPACSLWAAIEWYQPSPPFVSRACSVPTSVPSFQVIQTGNSSPNTHSKSASRINNAVVHRVLSGTYIDSKLPLPPRKGTAGVTHVYEAQICSPVRLEYSILRKTCVVPWNVRKCPTQKRRSILPLSLIHHHFYSQKCPPQRGQQSRDLEPSFQEVKRGEADANAHRSLHPVHAQSLEQSAHSVLLEHRLHGGGTGRVVKWFIAKTYGRTTVPHSRKLRNKEQMKVLTKLE